MSSILNTPGLTTPPESDQELANAPTPDTASGAIQSKETPNTKQATTNAAANAELLRKLQLQVEFYFSAENLAKDHYLVSQMNGEKYVLISLIAGFAKVSAMTTDPSLVAKSVANSTVCSVDATGTKIRPVSMKFQERNTIMLRDLKTATETDVRELFKNEEKCGKIVAIRSDIGDTWFITMESEDIAKDSLLALRGKELKGNKIRGNLKSKSVARSSFGTTSVDAPAFVPSFKPAGSGGASVGGLVGKDGKVQPKSLMSGGAVPRQTTPQMGLTAEQQTAQLAQYYGMSVKDMGRAMGGMNPFLYTQMMNNNYYMTMMQQQQQQQQNSNYRFQGNNNNGKMNNSYNGRQNNVNGQGRNGGGNRMMNGHNNQGKYIHQMRTQWANQAVILSFGIPFFY